MKITKRQLKRIIKEEKSKLIKEQALPLQTFRVTMLVAVAPGQEGYILNSIEDGMEFDKDMGEGVLQYDIKEEG
jgi:hypothetical protein